MSLENINNSINFNQPATKGDLVGFAMKTDLVNFATKEDLKSEIQSVRNDLGMAIAQLDMKLDRTVEELRGDIYHMRNEIMNSNDYVIKKLNRFIDEQAALKVNYLRINGNIEKMTQAV